VTVRDSCLRPEASTVTWQVYDGTAWVDAPRSPRLRRRGYFSGIGYLHSGAGCAPSRSGAPLGVRVVEGFACKVVDVRLQSESLGGQ